MTSPPPAQPVAFRLKRPYDDEDHFVEGDGHGIFKSGMVLIGAGPRPVGVIVRFEVALRDGIALFRGEGKVAGHRTSAEGHKPAGLEIKFTRLDARGKQIVDRVLTARASKDLSANPPRAIPDLTPAPDATKMEARVASVPPPATSSGPIDVPTDAMSSGPVEDPPEPAAEVDDDAETRALPPVAAAAVDVTVVEESRETDANDAPDSAPEPTVITNAAVNETRPYEFPVKAIPDGARDSLLGRLRGRGNDVAIQAIENRPSLLGKLRSRVA